ncbi:MAG TPA: glutaredoxin [Gammaproteobacteria bacterium]|nr:glutaredoxin [Gammaproteobacteria bacterium]
MKWLIRIFFKTIRAILGPILLAGDWLTTPRGIKRPLDEQTQLDEATQKLTLYQFKTCPFCIKTRRAIKRMSLNIKTLDAQRNMENRNQLLQGGGQIKVPCLKVTDNQGKDAWMYESKEIIQYLQNNFE